MDSRAPQARNRADRSASQWTADLSLPLGYIQSASTAAAMNQSTSGPEIFTTNPYTDHPSLSETEAEVLWQYAKLSQNIKEVRVTDAWSPLKSTSQVSA